MTVDEILEAGEYTDRRGRMWAIAMTDGRWGATDGRYLIGGKPFSVDRMRLLIERDMHRKECPGLSACNGHPVPSVITPFAWGSRDFEVYAAWANTTSTFKQSLPEAMDAARALAVGE